MKFKIKNELITIDVLTLALILVINLIPVSGIRIVLGLPFLLFFPGYMLIAALFPGKSGMDGFERIALSFAMSIVVTPLIGLVLNYTPWGIRLDTVLYSVSLFILVASFAAWLRRRRLPEPDRFSAGMEIGTPGWNGNVLEKTLSVILALSVIGTVATLGYVIANPKAGERFSEFYILGPGGKATDYPKELRTNETAEVIVGIINHEQIPVTYRVEVRIDGVKNSETAPVMLENEGKWEGRVGFTPAAVGDNQVVEFLLFRDNEADYNLESLLRINVKD